MPRHTHLMRRGLRYYLNVRVPKDLRPILKKEHIRKSLGTSDYSVAVQGLRLASLKQHTEFAELRAKLRAAKSDAPQKVERLSDEDVYSLVVKFLNAARCFEAALNPNGVLETFGPEWNKLRTKRPKVRMIRAANAR